MLVTTSNDGRRIKAIPQSIEFLEKGKRSMKVKIKEKEIASDGNSPIETAV